MYKYTHFIPENTAPAGANSIGVYNGSGGRVCTIPLGPLARPAGEKLYSFGLVSDMHFYKKGESWVTWSPETKFDAALTFFESEGCVFCAHCGDITQTGLYDEGDAVNLAPAQFDHYKEVCDQHAIPVYGVCGNHESYVVPITSNLAELEEYTGKGLYFTVEQGEDLFIFLGQPQGNKVMGDDALQWLYGTLEENRNRRCFVFVHAYIEEDSGDALDVRENSIFESWGTARTTAFMNLLRHYKNTVLFHGHSHMKFWCQELDRNANYTERNGFRSVHVPSSGYPRDIVNNASVNDYSASEGYVVDVYGDCIVLNGRDFIGNAPVPIGTYEIDTTLVEVEAAPSEA